MTATLRDSGLAPTVMLATDHRASRREARWSRRCGICQTPAVVLGAAGNCGLGVIRSLHANGIPVILADPNLAEPAMRTRLAHKHVLSAGRGQALIEGLLALGATLKSRPMLFLTSDEAVAAVSEYRAEVDPHFRLRLPSHACLTALMHKSSFQQLAELHGFPVPRSATIRRSSDLALLANLRFPCIIKPSTKTEEYIKRRFARAYRVDARDQAEQVCRSILPTVPGLVAQEWIEGDGDDLYFCLQYIGADGRPVCSFTGRKLSIWPPDVGITASCTAAPEAKAILEPLTEAFFRATGFVGMGSMEFKKDARTGEFLMIEPTVGRVDNQEEVATLHSVNIPFAAYAYELGLDVPKAVESPAPVIWQDTLSHWRSTRGQRPKRAPRRGIHIRDAYWRASDPMPAVLHAWTTVKRGLRNALKATN